jgi:hypothetical protein
MDEWALLEGLAANDGSGYPELNKKPQTLLRTARSQQTSEFVFPPGLQHMASVRRPFAAIGTINCWLHGCEGRSFSSMGNYRRHCREKDGLVKKATCPRCGRQFTRDATRHAHFQQQRCRFVAYDANGVPSWRSLRSPESNTAVVAYANDTSMSWSSSGLSTLQGALIDPSLAQWIHSNDHVRSTQEMDSVTVTGAQTPFADSYLSSRHGAPMTESRCDNQLGNMDGNTRYCLLRCTGSHGLHD